MKIKVSKKELERALAVASTTLAPSDADLGISSHYLFRFRGETAEILTYRGRIFSRVPFEAEFKAEGTFTIEGKRLKLALSYLNDETLVLDYPGRAQVTLHFSEGNIGFPSADTTKFPFWDDIFNRAYKTGEVPVENLIKVLTYARFFVSADESRAPQLCVTEVRGGAFYATDNASIMRVQVQGLEKASLRIHGRDIPAIRSFLKSLPKESTVEVYEDAEEKGVACFFKGADGSVFGEARPVLAFALLEDLEKRARGMYWWTFDRQDFLRKVNLLRSGASWDLDYVTLRPIEGDRVQLVMPTMVHKEATCEMVLTERGAVDGAPTLKEFSLFHRYLAGIFSVFEGDTVRMDIIRTPDYGFVAFREGVGSDHYLALLMMRKEGG